MRAIFVTNMIYKTYDTLMTSINIRSITSYNTTHKDFHEVKINTIIGVYVGHSPNHHGEISRVCVCVCVCVGGGGGGVGGGGGGGTLTNSHTGVCRSIGSILKGQFP